MKGLSSQKAFYFNHFPLAQLMLTADTPGSIPSHSSPQTRNYASHHDQQNDQEQINPENKAR
jgi:hypothetical protein